MEIENKKQLSLKGSSGEGPVRVRHGPGIAFCLLLVTALVIISGDAHATLVYAKRTSQDCHVCHINPAGGGALTSTGSAFSHGGYIWPPAPVKKSTPFSRFLELTAPVLGFIHLTTAVIWFGTIFYVHLVLRPRYALGGLPRAEVRLAWACIAVLGATGFPLTLMHFPKIIFLLSTASGRLLLIKIALYLFMVATAAFVTLFIGPKLRALRKGWSENDGRRGNPAWVKVEDKIYDFSNSPLWKDGSHMLRHRAGQDLTEALKDAPHGLEKLERFPSFPAEKTSPENTPVARVFYALAYINLFVALGILVIIALRRWS